MGINKEMATHNLVVLRLTLVAVAIYIVIAALYASFSEEEAHTEPAFTHQQLIKR